MCALQDFQFDKWRVDVAVTGSQKALSIPTGLGMVCASDKVGSGGVGMTAELVVACSSLFNKCQQS